MSWAAVISLALLAAGPAAPDAGEPAPLDPELEVLATSLLPEQRAEVDAACGGLGRLPRYRLDLRLNPDDGVLSGLEQVSLIATAEMSELYLRVPANATWLDTGLGQAVSLAAARRGDGVLPLDSLDNGV